MARVREYYVVAKVRNHEDLGATDLNLLAEDLATKLPPENYASVRVLGVDDSSNLVRPSWAAIYQVSPPEVH